MGNAQPHIYEKDIKQIKIPDTSIVLQNKFASYVEEIDKLKFDIFQNFKQEKKTIVILLIVFYLATQRLIKLIF